MRACFSCKQKQRACFLKFKPFLFHNFKSSGNLSRNVSCCLTSLKTSFQKFFSSMSNLLWIFQLKEKFLEEPILIVKKKWTWGTDSMIRWIFLVKLSSQRQRQKSNLRKKSFEGWGSELWQNLVIWIMFQQRQLWHKVFQDFKITVFLWG